MKIEKFNEATRVQIPAMVHLTRLGYKYYGKICAENAKKLEPDTNILLEVFEKQFQRLNPDHKGEYSQILQDIRKELNDDDLGRGFYQRLKSVSPTKLIDFDNYENNVFHFVAELTYKNGEKSFRPDITLFVNGLPLCFIEVKKPNNSGGGIVAEVKRMNKRFSEPKYRRFINMTQLMIFSNNMEYDALGGVTPIEGAFYCTGARNEIVPLNCFREDNPQGKRVSLFHEGYSYKEIDSEVEKRIHCDYNCQDLHHTQEYKTNLSQYTPTNRILTSLCSPERLLYMLRYGIAYVRMEREVDGKIESIDQKHIMRYQQLLASLAIKHKLSEGTRSGIIWHTQGSGKTALSYHLTLVLKDYFAHQNKVAKFYFIVDRLDLLEQATQEFEARGLSVKTANTRRELMEQFRINQSQNGTDGKDEITVVNIQRFYEDTQPIEFDAYATKLQRVFILDEAHRSYRRGGSFLANLFNAARDAIKIALTGTPLLKEERASCKVFGDYLHTYYYDRSIADGYTLKIMREDIENSYKDKLTVVYDELATLGQKKKNNVSKEKIIEHNKYVNELLRYIIKDLIRFRQVHEDESLGGMIVCATGGQAKKLYEYFDSISQEIEPNNPLKAGLILHDHEDQETRKRIVNDFKKNMTIDILIVYKMLLTGFDAPRLKRLYLGRELKEHNLLQAITRVNRPYKNFRYGFLIDFVDIKRNFDETNEAYIKELSRFNEVAEVGDVSVNIFQQFLVNKEEIIEEMKDIRQILFNYPIDNIEEFGKAITNIEKSSLMELKRVLNSAKDNANQVRTYGDEEMRTLFSEVNILNFPKLLKEVERRINMINWKEGLFRNAENKIQLNEDILDIEFYFSKRLEEELNFFDGGGIEALTQKLQQAVTTRSQNYDQEDPIFIALTNDLFEQISNTGFVINTLDECKAKMSFLDNVIRKLQEIENSNNILLSKYSGDIKFVCVHKRIREANVQRKENNKVPIFSFRDEDIVKNLNIIKEKVDTEVSNKTDILNKSKKDYFSKQVLRIINECLPSQNLEREACNFVRDKIIEQYYNSQNNISYA